MCGALMLLTGKWTTKGVHTVKSLIRTRIWTLWTSTACPVPRATARRWWTDAAGRYPPALCGPCKPFLGSACLSAHPLLPAGRRQLRRNGELLLGVQQRTGCKILLAQKAFSNFNVYPVLAPYLAGTEASGLYESRLGKEELPEKENHVFCAAYRADEFAELLQYADHIVFNSPRPAGKVRPGSKGGGQERGPAAEPGVLHSGRPCKFTTLRPGQPPWHHPRPVGCRRAGRPGPARITGRTALPHPVRTGCRCTGPDAGGGWSKVRGLLPG